MHYSQGVPGQCRYGQHARHSILQCACAAGHPRVVDSCTMIPMILTSLVAVEAEAVEEMVAAACTRTSRGCRVSATTGKGGI